MSVPIGAVLMVGACTYVGVGAGLGVYVAGQKRRSKAEGFWLGCCFGPLGVLLVALLPTGPEPSKPARRPRARPGVSARPGPELEVPDEWLS